MKRALIMGLLAVSFGTVACAGEPDGDVGPAAEQEAVAEVEQELNQYNVMGNIGWASTAGLTNDLAVFHEISNVANKWATVDVIGDFPNLEGVAATSTNLAKCTGAYVEMFAYTRPSSASPWAQVHHVKKFAQAKVSNGIIADCVAVYEMSDCDAIGFTSTTNFFKVEVGSAGGQSYVQPKADTVRYQSINLLNCS
ncbi:MAG TPA: hypothetical protein VFS43_05465 [Polyangiaceae bacterium]|nr:hypothetical protein [Polyangiaceae bacterium]